jgi:catalase
VLDEAARDRLVSNKVGHLLKGVSDPVLVRAFEYWHNVDKDLGDSIDHEVRNQRPGTAPNAAEPGNPVGRTSQTRP